MDEVVRQVFKKDFDLAEAAGTDLGKVQIAEALLKDHVSLKKIARWSGMSLDRIVEIAEKIGVTSLTL